MLFVKPPAFYRILFPKAIWDLSSEDPILYLTFDDGPIPESTPWILDVLAKYQVKATFFCVGENVEKYPEIYQRILDEGHAVGNHTFNHLNGWKTDAKTYLENIKRCPIQSGLFRPPYGKIGYRQYRKVINENYKVIFWSLLSYDFSNKHSGAFCLKLLMKNIRKGAIIGCHDNIKAIPRVTYFLEPFIEHCVESKYEFKAL